MSIYVPIAETLNNISSFFINIDWSNPTWDLVILVFFIVASLLYGFSLGRDRLLVILVSIYMAIAIIHTVPYFSKVTAELNFGGAWVLRTSLFLSVFAVLFFFLSRSALLRTFGGKDSVAGGWLQIILFSFLHVGLLISVTLSFLPPEAIANLSEFTRGFFVSDMAKAGWMIGPLVAMVIKGE